MFNLFFHKNLLIFTISFCLLLHRCRTSQSVKYAAIIYRHGDRTPVETYPLDPYKNESFWPVPFGQLTNLGKRQHYALGQWLSIRYKHLISPMYDSKQIHVKSTDVDRTLMSAQVNLAGMFPPIGDNKWSDTILWQPIPVHTKPEKEDEVLAMKRVCPAYLKEKDKYLASPEYVKRLRQYKELMIYLTTHTGQKVKDYVDINDIYSTLYIETLYNFTLPNWTAAVYPDKMREPACYSFCLSAATPVMARLSIGPLLKEIVQNMNEVVSCRKDHKLSIYSGHDFTIGTLLTALGVFDGNCPAYTSTIFMELLEDEGSELIGTSGDSGCKQHYVRISYRNSPEIVEPKVLFLPNCGKMCPLEKFINLYANLVNVNWQDECELKISTSFVTISMISGIAVVYLLYKIFFIKIQAPLREPEDFGTVNWLSSPTASGFLGRQAKRDFDMIMMREYYARSCRANP